MFPISRFIGNFCIALGHTLFILGELLVHEKQNPDNLTILDDAIMIGEKDDK